MTRTNTPTPLQPSDEVEAEAMRRAIQLADGLYPHQVEGLAFLLGRRRAILADDMGLGKPVKVFWRCRKQPPKAPGWWSARLQSSGTGRERFRRRLEVPKRSPWLVQSRCRRSHTLGGGHQLQHFDQTLV